MDKKQQVVEFLNICARNHSEFDIFIMNLSNKSINRRVYDGNEDIVKQVIKNISLYSEDLIDPSVSFQIVLVRLHSDDAMGQEDKKHNVVYVSSNPKNKYNYSLEEYQSEI